MDNKRFALLIDADNISAKYIGVILEELSTYGITTCKRIYGDCTSTQANNWKGELLENSDIFCIQGMWKGSVSYPATVISPALPVVFGNRAWK